MQIKILLIESDLTHAQYLNVLLHSANYKIETARGGRDGLNFLKEEPDLVLLNHKLPDIEGLVVCREIRENKHYNHIPIIMMTTRDSADERVESLFLGADDCITLPFAQKELLARIQAVLRRHEFMDRRGESKEQTIAALKTIQKEEKLATYYQPIFSLKDYKSCGFEVLTRPEVEGFLANPEIFFRVAHQFGMYVEFEKIGWKKAIEQYNAHGGKEKLFLNCSPYFIESEAFDADLFKEIGVDPKCVVLEITERLAIKDYGNFIDRLQKIKELGVRFSVDDVGSGYASLDTVAEIMPHYVKIDRCLIKEIHKNRLKRDIVQAIMVFSRKNNIKVMAEGIEDIKEFNVVTNLEIDYAQGFFLGKPQINIESRSIKHLKSD